MNERILQELRNHSNAVFNNLNLELSSLLREGFNVLLTDSVNRMEREGKTSPSDLDRAKQAYTKYINSMYASREKGSGGKDIIRLQAMNESKSSLCPLWPIC